MYISNLNLNLKCFCLATQDLGPRTGLRPFLTFDTWVTWVLTIHHACCVVLLAQPAAF